jgi:DNA-binding response OmpR family regulator
MAAHLAQLLHAQPQLCVFYMCVKAQTDIPARFKLAFPEFKKDQEAPVPSNPLPRVLCVDDDEDSRLMLSTLLRSALIEAKAVETAAQALSLVQVEHFDLYLLDSRLPDIDGFELCRRMRDFDPDTPILFFSGAAYADDQKRGIEAGANAYLIKPDLDGLLGSIKQFVSRAKSAAGQIPAERELNNSLTLTYQTARA